MDEVAVRGVKLGEADHLHCHCYWPTLVRVQALAWFFLVFAGGGPLIYFSWELDPGFIQVVTSAGVMLVGLMGWLVASRLWRGAYFKALAKTPSGADPDDWFISGERVRTTSPSLTFEAPWRGFVDVRETPGAFHFVITPTMIFALPKRALGDDQEQRIRAFVASARARGDLKGIPG